MDSTLVKNVPTNEHAVTIGTSFTVYYPNHPPRIESSVFAKTKKHWHDTGAKCDVCGTVAQIEIHHKYIEWADSEGVDWDKVRLAHPLFEWPTFKDACDFIDSQYNTQPLCQLHHRGPAPYGKHFTPEPIWNMQMYMRADFVYAKKE